MSARNLSETKIRIEITQHSPEDSEKTGVYVETVLQEYWVSTGGRLDGDQMAEAIMAMIEENDFLVCSEVTDDDHKYMHDEYFP